MDPGQKEYSDGNHSRHSVSPALFSSRVASLSGVVRVRAVAKVFRAHRVSITVAFQPSKVAIAPQ